MSHVLVTTDSTGKTWHSYRNDSSVGQGGDNCRRSDIQLVQFFLDQFYDADSAPEVQLPYAANSGGMSVVIDGKVGIQTIVAIHGFQKWVNRTKGPALVVDGKVSVPQGFGIPGTGLKYTMQALNFWFFSWSDDSDSNREWQGNLRNHEMIQAYAPELQAELAAVEE